MARSEDAEERRRRARVAAQRRLAELRREEAAIHTAFPELLTADRSTPQGRLAPRRSTMSPAMRRAVSERMKSYWAARRQAKNG